MNLTKALRIILTGRNNGPDLTIILEALGKKETLHRLNAFLELYKE